VRDEMPSRGTDTAAESSAPMETTDRDGLLLSPGEGDSFFALSDWAVCKVRAEWTGGRFSVVEQTTVPGARPPLHFHEFDEIHYILEGEYDYWQADKPPRRATAGSVVWTPRRVVHTYKNVGTTN